MTQRGTLAAGGQFVLLYVYALIVCPSQLFGRRPAPSCRHPTPLPAPQTFGEEYEEEEEGSEGKSKISEVNTVKEGEEGM